MLMINTLDMGINLMIFKILFMTLSGLDQLTIGKNSGPKKQRICLGQSFQRRFWIQVTNICIDGIQMEK